WCCCSSASRFSPIPPATTSLREATIDAARIVGAGGGVRHHPLQAGSTANPQRVVALDRPAGGGARRVGICRRDVSQGQRRAAAGPGYFALPVAAVGFCRRVVLLFWAGKAGRAKAGEEFASDSANRHEPEYGLARSARGR